MGKYNFPFIHIGPNNANIVSPFSGAGSQSLGVPNMMNGTKPKYLWLMATGGAAANVNTISCGNTGGGTVDTGMLMPHVSPVPIILNVVGITRVLKWSSGDGNSTLWAYPLEDF